jgi:hypothetical protein
VPWPGQPASPGCRRSWLLGEHHRHRCPGEVTGQHERTGVPERRQLFGGQAGPLGLGGGEGQGSPPGGDPGLVGDQDLQVVDQLTDTGEEWSSTLGRKHYLRPDAYVGIAISVDDAPGVAGTFVEIDFATMDQARLRAKIARHRAYASDGAWWAKHPGCPVLLLLTTSEARDALFFDV